MAKRAEDIIVMFDHISYVAKGGVIYRQDIPQIWRGSNPAQAERYLIKKYGKRGLKIVDRETIGAAEAEKVMKEEGGINGDNRRGSDR